MFATAPIPLGTTLGEYLGELIPKGTFVPGDRYGFQLERPGCTARRFGNITRFVNHHCDPNVGTESCMYGKRVVVLFKAVDDIAAGQQIFISYGRSYFTGLNILCMCNHQAGDHLPPADPEDRQAAAKKGVAKKGAAKKGAAKKGAAKKGAVKKGAAMKGAAKAAAKKAVAKKAAAKKAAGKKAAGIKAAGKKVAGGKLTKAAGVKKAVKKAVKKGVKKG